MEVGTVSAIGFVIAAAKLVFKNVRPTVYAKLRLSVVPKPAQANMNLWQCSAGTILRWRVHIREWQLKKGLRQTLARRY
jgi:hypothetical protein